MSDDNLNEIEKLNVSDSVQTENNLFMLNNKILPKYNYFYSEQKKNNKFFNINSYNNKNNNNNNEYFNSNNIEFQNQLLNDKIEINFNKKKFIKKIKFDNFIKDNLNSNYYLNNNLKKIEKNNEFENESEVEKFLLKELKNKKNNNIDNSEYIKKDYPNNKLLSIYEIKFDNCFKNYKLKNNFRNRLKSLSTISIFNKNPEKKKIKSFHKNLSALQTFINSNNNYPKNNKNINYIKSIYNDCISFGNNNNKNFQNQIEETKIFNIKNKLKIINKKRNNIHNFPLNGINIKNISYSNNNSYKNIHKEFKKRNKIINRNLPTSELYYKNQKNKLILFPNSMIISNNKKTSNSNNNSINKEQKKLENKTNNNSYNYKSQSTISYLPYLSKIGIKKLKLNN